MHWIIGEQAGIGQGWRMLMNCLAVGRGISLPAITTGAVKFVARTTGAYARVRKQFNLPIGKFEGIEEPLARIAGQAYAMEAARKVTCVALDQGHEPAVISALMKYQMTERQRQCINDSMDIHGGRGICEGPGNYLFNLYQSIPINITVEGANILTRSLIVFGQGAIRCHPWLLKEMQAAKLDDQKTALNEFDHAVGGHVRFLLSIALRTTLRASFKSSASFSLRMSFCNASSICCSGSIVCMRPFLIALTRRCSIDSVSILIRMATSSRPMMSLGSSLR